MELFIEIAQVDSGGFAFVLLCCKGAIIELDSRVQLGTDIGEDPDMLGIFRTGISIKKAIQSELEYFYFLLWPCKSRINLISLSLLIS